MKFSNIKATNMDKYSLKDIEYGVKLLYKEIEEINIAIKVIKRITTNRHSSKYAFKHILPNIIVKDTHIYIKEKERLLDMIRIAENEICDRVLIGNDDLFL